MPKGKRHCATAAERTSENDAASLCALRGRYRRVRLLRSFSSEVAMSVTRLELSHLVALIWPATTLQNAHERTDGGWSIRLTAGPGRLVTWHDIDGNGHPLCHDDCKRRESGVSIEPALSHIRASRPPNRDESTRYAVSETLAWIGRCDAEYRLPDSAQIAEFAIAKFLDHQARPRTDTR